MLTFIPPVVCTYTDTGMGLLIYVMYAVAPPSNIVVVNTSTLGTFYGVGGPMVYMVNIVVTIAGTYNITSMVPNCVGKILNTHIVLLLIIKSNFIEPICIS